MSPDETEQPKRRRRKAKPADAPEVSSASEANSSASESEETSEVDPTPADVEAEEAAADVMLEADAEAEGEASDADAEAPAGSVQAEATADDEAPAPAPARRRRRRGAAAAEEPAAPAPAPARRRRPARDPNLPPPVVRAHAKYVRSSARKARLVCDHIRGKTVEEARAILAHTPRAVAKDWSKLLESAVANAEHNHELVGEDLYVKAVKADEGPTIKRFQPRAMGRATKIRKRTTHLTILLTPKD